VTPDAIGLATFFTALIAAVASVYAIRRDRASLRVWEDHAMAGQWSLTIVNVGLRPVRVISLFARRHRWGVWEQRLDCWFMVQQPDDDFVFPRVFEPGDQLLLLMFPLPDPEVWGTPEAQDAERKRQEGRRLPPGYRTWVLQDASGALYVAASGAPWEQRPRWRRVANRLTFERVPRNPTRLL